MGDGVVLEQGTHSELLRNETGPYARLVAAQQLREKRDVDLRDSDKDTIASGEADNTEKKVRTEGLGHKISGHSVASDICEQKGQAIGNKKQEHDYSLLYLFMRMGKLNRDVWRNYGIGAVAACCAYHSVYCHV